jgi:hypothetical protein
VAQPIRTSIRTIALAIQTQIMAITGFKSDRVGIVGDGVIPHFTATQDVLIRLMDENGDDDALHGAGRVDDRRDRHMTIVCRVRSQQDQAGSDLLRLTRLTTGLVTLEDQVMDALQIFQPQDNVSNVITPEPMRIINGPHAPRHDPDDINWISSEIDLTVKYIRNLDQSRQ